MCDSVTQINMMLNSDHLLEYTNANNYTPRIGSHRCIDNFQVNNAHTSVRTRNDLRTRAHSPDFRAQLCTHTCANTCATAVKAAGCSTRKKDPRGRGSRGGMQRNRIGWRGSRRGNQIHFLINNEMKRMSQASPKTADGAIAGPGTCG